MHTIQWFWKSTSNRFIWTAPLLPPTASSQRQDWNWGNHMQQHYQVGQDEGRLACQANRSITLPCAPHIASTRFKLFLMSHLMCNDHLMRGCVVTSSYLVESRCLQVVLHVERNVFCQPWFRSFESSWCKRVVKQSLDSSRLGVQVHDHEHPIWPQYPAHLSLNTEKLLTIQTKIKKTMFGSKQIGIQTNENTVSMFRLFLGSEIEKHTELLSA